MKTQEARVENLEHKTRVKPALTEGQLVTNFLVSMRRVWDSWQCYTKTEPWHSYHKNMGITQDEADILTELVRATTGSEDANDKAAFELCSLCLTMPVRPRAELCPCEMQSDGLADWEVWNSGDVDAMSYGLIWKLSEEQYTPLDEQEQTA